MKFLYIEREEKKKKMDKVKGLIKS